MKNVEYYLVHDGRFIQEDRNPLDDSPVVGVLVVDGKVVINTSYQENFSEQASAYLKALTDNDIEYQLTRKRVAINSKHHGWKAQDGNMYQHSHWMVAPIGSEYPPKTHGEVLPYVVNG